MCAIGARDVETGELAVFEADGTRYESDGMSSALKTVGGRVALGDVTGDGVEDRIEVGGPGGDPTVRIFDGDTDSELASFAAYEGEFKGGIYVGAGDLNGDGLVEIVTGTDQGGGPRVRVGEDPSSRRPGVPGEVTPP